MFPISDKSTVHGIATIALAVGFALFVFGFFFDQKEVGPGVNFGAAFALFGGLLVGGVGLIMAILSVFIRSDHDHRRG